MGKNKKNKKKNGGCKKMEPEEEQLDLTLVDADYTPIRMEICGSSIRSDDAAPPSCDDSSSTADAGKDEEISLDGLQLNEGKERLRSLIRARSSWEAMAQSWKQDCSQFYKTMNDANEKFGLTGSQAFMVAYKTLEKEQEEERLERRKRMAENAKAHGVKPLPFMEDVSLSRGAAFVPPITPQFSAKGLQEVIAKWKAVQDTYPIGKPQVENSPSHDSWTRNLFSDTDDLPDVQPLKDSILFQPRKLKTEDEEENPGPAPVPSPSSVNLPRPQPVPRPRPKNMDDYIRVRVLCPDHEDMMVSLKGSLTMLKLKERHSQKLGRNPKSLVYRYKGKNLRDSDTVVSLGMIADDVIHVVKAPPPRRH